MTPPPVVGSAPVSVPPLEIVAAFTTTPEGTVSVTVTPYAVLKVLPLELLTFSV